MSTVPRRRALTAALTTLMAAAAVPLVLSGPAQAATGTLGGSGVNWDVSDDELVGGPEPTAFCGDGPEASGAVVTDGILADGTVDGRDDAFDDAAVVFVDGRQLAGALTTSGAVATFAPESVGGLTTQLTYEALQDAPRLRVLARITNTGSSATTVPVDYATNFGSDTSTTVLETTSGDATLELSDRWLITDDAGEGDPVNTTVWQGLGAPVPASTVASETFGCSGTEGLRAGFSVPVPAGQSRTLMFFQEVNSTPALSRTATEDYEGPGAAPDLTSGLTAGQLAEIVNWDAVAPAVTSSSTASSDGQSVRVAGTVTDAARTTVSVTVRDGAGTPTAARTTSLTPPARDFSFDVDVSGLADGTLTATTTATDAAGNVTNATSTSTKQTARAPSAPRNASATQTGPRQVTITFDAPADAGSSPVTGYRVALGTSSALYPAEPRRVVLDDVAPGTYVASVKAVNAAGTGPETTTSVTVTAPSPSPSPSTSPSSSPSASASVSPSASASASPSASASTSRSASPSASASSSATASASPSTPGPSASATPAPPVDRCTTRPVTSLQSTSVGAGAPARVNVSGVPAGSTVDLHAYTRPSTTFRVVRTAVVSGDTATFDVVPPANTRLFAVVRGCSSGSDAVVLNVRTTLSLLAARTGPRRYVFSGDSLPARPGGLVVSLYRVTASGQQVLAAQTRASAADGEWSIERVFTGTGRFAFVVRTGQDLQNAPGTSNVRPTLVF